MRLVSVARGLENALEAGGGRFDQRRARGAHGADQLRRVEGTERGWNSARPRRRLRPGARRDIAADASAIAVCAVAASRMGDARSKGRTADLPSRSRGRDDKCEERTPGKARRPQAALPPPEMIAIHHQPG